VCWSEPADLIMGSVVAGIGLVGIGVSRDRHDVPLAALPVLLGAHQLIESRIWHASAGPGSELHGTAVTLWTLIAFVVLPLFVPAAMLYAERRRNRVQWFAAVCGVPVAVLMAIEVSRGGQATDHGHVLTYGAGDGVRLLPVAFGLYLIATCLPFLASPEPTMRELGIGLVIGAVAATVADVAAFASIWCALAALVSVLIVRRTVHASRYLCPARR
jgi:hypothetical protein